LAIADEDGRPDVSVVKDSVVALVVVDALAMREILVVETDMTDAVVSSIIVVAEASASTFIELLDTLVDVSALPGGGVPGPAEILELESSAALARIRSDFVDAIDRVGRARVWVSAFVNIAFRYFTRVDTSSLVDRVQIRERAGVLDESSVEASSASFAGFFVWKKRQQFIVIMRRVSADLTSLSQILLAEWHFCAAAKALVPHDGFCIALLGGGEVEALSDGETNIEIGDKTRVEIKRDVARLVSINVHEGAIS
jgi:hypothetical protein